MRILLACVVVSCMVRERASARACTGRHACKNSEARKQIVGGGCACSKRMQVSWKRVSWKRVSTGRYSVNSALLSRQQGVTLRVSTGRASPGVLQYV
jgi:hypothetical protein